MLMAESRDAITWRPATLQRSAHAAVPNAVLNDAGNEFSVVYDDAAHVGAGSPERLKCLWGNATVSVSADGVAWRPFCKWSSKGVDPGTSVFRNPLDTDEIVITARPQEMRRAGRHMGTHAARTWAALGLAENSQMLPLDETYSVYDQQYGLPSFAYGGMVVSWFWRYRCPGVHGQCFSGGYVSVAMGYSYNSRNWTAFGQQLGGGGGASAEAQAAPAPPLPPVPPPKYPLPEIFPNVPGTATSGQVYPNTLIEDPNDPTRLLVHASASTHQHGLVGPANWSSLLTYALRKDGFVYAAASGDSVTFETKPLKWHGGELTVNADCDAGTGVTIAVMEGGKVLDGFAAANAQKIQGDHVAATATWTGHSMQSLAGKTLQLQVTLGGGAKLFSLRGDFSAASSQW